MFGTVAKYGSSRQLVAALAAILAGVAIAACGSSSRAAPGSAAGSTGSSGGKAGLTGTVYALLPNSTVVWSSEYGPLLRSALKAVAPGLTLKILNANQNVQQQESQAQAAVSNGAKAIIVAPVDTNQSSGIFATAQRAGIPVIDWVNDPGPGEVKYYVGYPMKEMGELQAKYIADHLPAKPRPYRLALMLGDPGWSIYTTQVAGFNKYLEPLVKKGTIKIVCNYDTPGWMPATTTTNMQQCLTKTHGEVDGVWGHNDETLTGAFAAVQSQGLQDKIKVMNGIDGTLPAMQRLVTGHQIVDLILDYKAITRDVAKLIPDAITGTKPPAGTFNTTFNNKTMDIPEATPSPILVTPKNIQKTIVDSGVWTKAQICHGLTGNVPFCGTK